MSALTIPRTLWVIERGEVREYRYEGPSQVFTTFDDAAKYLDKMRAARITELETELTALRALEAKNG